MSSGDLDRDSIRYAMQVGLRSLQFDGDVTVGTSLAVYRTVNSTNTTVEEQGRTGAASGLTIFAEEQRSGRGRKGNAWVSPPGANLLFSVLLRPTQPLPEWPRLAHGVGLAVARAIQPWLPKEAELKWPNDVLVEGRKIAGILLETFVQSQSPFLVLGIGLNVNTRQEDFPEELQPTVTTLRDQNGGIPLDRHELAGAILAELNFTLERCVRDFEGVLAEVRSRSALLGKQVRLLQHGSWLRGKVADFGPEGELLLKDETGIQQLISSAELVRIEGNFL